MKKCYSATQKNAQFGKSAIPTKLQYEKSATRKKCNSKKDVI